VSESQAGSKMSLPSASSLQLAAICAGSQVLPHVRSLASGAMERGTAIHRFLELVRPESDRETAIAQVPVEYQDLCRLIELSGLPIGEQYQREVGLAWNHATGAGRLFEVVNRKYKDIDPAEFYGTSDVVGIFENHVEIWDWKVGFGGHLTAPEHNLQLKFYALAAARAHGKLEARVGLIKINEEGDITRLDHSLGELDLLMVESELRDIATNVRKAQRQQVDRGVPDVVEGPHCKNCPAQLHCPARLGLLQKVFGLDVQTIAKTLSTKAKAEAYQKASAIRDIAEQIIKAVKDSVHEEPVDIGNGRTLKLVNVQNKVIDSDANKVIDALKEEFGDEVARNVVFNSLDLTQTAIKKALQSHAKTLNEPAAKLYREAETLLTRRGLMSIRASSSIREVATPKPELNE